MNYQLLYAVTFVLGFIGILGVCEYLHKKKNIPAEFTRKIGHSASALVALSFPFLFTSDVYVIAIGIFCFFLLFGGKLLKVFKSINSVDRKTGGSYLLPISICSLFVFSKGNNLFFILPILVLGISDALAGLFGTIYKDKTRKIVLFKRELDKTFIGTSVFAISTVIISLITLILYSNSIGYILLMSFCITVVATFIEVISPKGTDNITVPYSIFLLLLLS